MRPPPPPVLPIILAALLFGGCDRPPAPSITLYRAVQVGDLEQIKRHIRAGSDLDQADPNGDRPLHVAARAGQVTMVRELVDHGADLTAPNGEGLTPMELALRHGKTQVAERLAAAGAPLDPQASLVVLVRAGVSDRDSFDFLIRRGAAVNRPDEDGQTPLHLAVGLGRLEAARRLLQRGADVNRPRSDGATPLALALTLDPKAADTADMLATLRQFGARLPQGAAPPVHPQPEPTGKPQ